MDRICVHFLVSGRVQGVWYRNNTREQALKLQLTGWVRNLPDGRVEINVCGEEAKINQLEKWLWQGPSLAQVTAVEKDKINWQDFSDFVVK